MDYLQAIQDLAWGEFFPTKIVKVDNADNGETHVEAEFARDTGEEMCPGCELDQDCHSCQLLPIFDTATAVVVLDGGVFVRVEPELD